MDIRSWTEPSITQALGRSHRADPALPSTGGPAGNARLTAWTGLVLLVLFLAELVTLLNVSGLVGWHIALGVLLIPPALLKCGTTTWRIVRYYRGSVPYRQAGPPPLLLRILGPLVIATTLAVLGSGLALIFVAPTTARDPLLTVAGYGVAPLTVHKAAFVAWGVATGLHTLGRLVPALQLTVLRGGAARLDGTAVRAATVGVTVVVATIAAVLSLTLIGPWRDHPSRHEARPPHVQTR